MLANVFSHPLATSEWESLPAATVRLHTRSVWAERIEGEESAPARRIIHLRAAFADEPMRLDSLQASVAAGYHKCASGQEVDSIVRARLWTPDEAGWTLAGELRRTRSEALTEPTAIPLDLETRGFVAELREATTDRWWPGWNLANTGLTLSGDIPSAWTPRNQGALEIESIDLSNLPNGVAAEHRNSEIRYTTGSLSIGFRLRSPAWSYLSVDDDGAGRHDRNLLQQPRSMDIVRSGVYPSGVYPVLRDQNAEYLAQGPRFTSHDGDRPVGFLAYDYEGSVSVRGNVVRYDVNIPSADQRYEYEYTIERDHIQMRVRRTSRSVRRAWMSSAWHVATDNRITPSTVIGRLTERGETGIIAGDAAWHFPRHGTFVITSSGDDVLLRSDSVRALDTNTLEFKLGETPTEFGDYVLEAGDFEAVVTLAAGTPRLARLSPDAPAVVRRMVDRHALTGLPFRSDTATYSNNGASMHCTTTLNDISAIARELDELPGGIHPMQLVGISLRRWLDGAPSYGSGSTSHGPHRLEDEYVQMAANTLVALARYLEYDDDPTWFAAHEHRILAEIDAMLARDVDGDGLVESSIRRGISGEHQWSSAWADVISFGWKDAWANAALFQTWTELAPVLDRFGQAHRADRCREAAERIRDTYLTTFFNDETGLIAGWRSFDGELHDYGFSLVTASACASELIDVDTARAIMQRLLEHWQLAGLGDWRNGIPLNLWRIPEEDIGGVIFGLPLGGYQQGGCSHHSARVIVDALYRVGMREEADALLTALSSTVADDSSFGGLGSGVDWRMWDGSPSGYEGQLAEGFSILASAVRRYS